jgi:hypothetical protein
VQVRELLKQRAEGCSISNKFQDVSADIDDKIPRLFHTLFLHFCQPEFNKSLSKLNS